MRSIIQFTVYKDKDYYVAEGVDIPVFTQGETLDETIQNIEEAMYLHLEGENLEELGFSDRPSTLVNLELTPHYAKP